MDMIISAPPKRLTSDITFFNYLLIVDAYYIITKLYGMEKITTEEVMDKLDMCQFPCSQNCETRNFFAQNMPKTIDLLES